MKRCSRCKQVLPTGDFYSDKKSKDGLSSRCKECVKENVRIHRNDPEYRKKQIAWNNKWRFRPENRQTVLDIRIRSQRKIYQGLKRAGFVTKEVRQKILKRDNHLCLSCGNDGNLTIDHITPIALGGTTHADNLQVLCRSCNAKKQQKSTCYRNR